MYIYDIYDIGIYEKISINLSIYLSIYLSHDHYHQVMLIAQNSLTLSPAVPIAPCFCRVLLTASSVCTVLMGICSCWSANTGSSMYIGLHKRTSLMCSSLLYQQRPACFVCFNWMVCAMGCKWPYSCFFCGFLLIGFIQNDTLHSCVVSNKLFLHAFHRSPCGASIQYLWYCHCLEEILFYIIREIRFQYHR